MLPWLRLAADMDPQKIETYTVGAYFLREHLNRPREAEAFLREGLRHNPNSYEILFELGRLYDENYHDTDRARDVWLLALNKWSERFKNDPKGAKENKLAFERNHRSPRPARTGMPATGSKPSIGFKPPKKFRRTRMRCNSGLTKSKQKWRRNLPPPTASRSE